MHKHFAFVFVILCIIGSFAQEKTSHSTIESDASSPVPSTTGTSTEATMTPEAPKSTTQKPTTTPPAPTTTTPAPTTITSAPNTTTPAPTTTPPPPTTTVTPTASSSPVAGNWTVTNSTNSSCIHAIMAVQFLNLPGKITMHNLSPNATTTGSTCDPADNNTQILMLKDSGFELEITFSHDELSSYVRNISLIIPDEEKPLHISEKYFVVHTGKSYYCSSKSDVKIDNSTIEFSSLHIQSFMHGEEQFGQAEDCAADDTMNDIVPISVAAALGGMVIIILIGYLVTRRQSRQRGYQSV